MGGQTILADIGAVHQTAHHHVPAHQALKPAKDEKSPQFPFGRAVDGAFGKKPDERDEEHNADQTAPKPVNEFQPEDVFEIIHGHPGIDFLEFRVLAVFGIKRSPVRVV